MPSRCRGGVAKERHSPYPMMDGMEKSDSVILAVKSANKGTSVPAEPMEQRTEPKGNLESQSTRRTQDRESVGKTPRPPAIAHLGAGGESPNLSTETPVCIYFDELHLSLHAGRHEKPQEKTKSTEGE